MKTLRRLISLVFLPIYLCLGAASVMASAVKEEASGARGFKIERPDEGSSFSGLSYIIVTKNLILAPIENKAMQALGPTLLLNSDLESLATLFTLSEDEAKISLSQYLQWFEEAYLAEQGRDEPRFLVFQASSEEGAFCCVGLVAVDRLESDARGASVSLYIARSAAGNGLGSEIAMAGLAWLRDASEAYAYVETKVRSDNLASLAICKKLGMKKVAVSNDFYLKPLQLNKDSGQTTEVLRSRLELQVHETHIMRITFR